MKKIVDSNKAEKIITNKKMLFYDLKGYLLIYESNSNFYFPKAITNSENDFFYDVKYQTNINFNIEHVEKFLEVSNYETRFNSLNSKFKKEYLKVIKDYYCYLISFKSYENQIFDKIDYGVPKIMKIDDIISILRVNENYFNNTLQSVYELKKRIGG